MVSKRNHFAIVQVKWFNRVLEEVWPFLNEVTALFFIFYSFTSPRFLSLSQISCQLMLQAVSGMLKMILQSVLDPYKFSIIQNITIKSITLGTLNPHIDGTQCVLYHCIICYGKLTISVFKHDNSNLNYWDNSKLGEGAVYHVEFPCQECNQLILLVLWLLKVEMNGQCMYCFESIVFLHDGNVS